MEKPVFRLFGIKEPMAKGLALGTSAHAIGTAKALELGEVEGAMSSLSIAVAGILTVIAVPLRQDCFNEAVKFRCEQLESRSRI